MLSYNDSPKLENDKLNLVNFEYFVAKNDFFHIDFKYFPNKGTSSYNIYGLCS